MAQSRLTHLEELSNSDYKIAEDQPNIDGWKVLNKSGQKIGKVKDFLFDREALKVRYLITSLKDGDLLDEDRKVLIPIGKAHINKEDDRVVVPDISREHLANLPHYDDLENMTQDDEYAVRNAFGAEGMAAGSTTYDREKFYDHDDFNEDHFYNENLDNDRTENRNQKIDVVDEELEVGKRKVQTGGVRVKSRLVEKPVEERVNLKTEHIHVTRNPVDRPATDKDLENFHDDTIEMSETEEFPVVNKKSRVVEEISLDKDVENHEKVIKDKVRHTEVDIENMTEEQRRNRDRDINDRDMSDKDMRDSNYDRKKDHDRNRDQDRDRNV